MLCENAKLDMAEEYWYNLLTVQQYYENCRNINEFALRFLTHMFNECTVEAQVSAFHSIKTSLRCLKHKTAGKSTFISTKGVHPLVALNVIEEELGVYFAGKLFCFVEYRILHFQGCQQAIS